MTRRSTPETANVIARIRQLQLQRAIRDSSRARAMCDLAAERSDSATAVRQAHVDAWRHAAGEGGLSIPVLDNFARAFDRISSELEAAREAAHQQRQAFEVSKQMLFRFDQLAARAKEDASRAARRHRQTIEERRMSEREVQTHPFTEDR